ncbi:hypothetical protein [Streptomyces sp. NPDC050564]|uniref:hypothetical protein n=1 Tax=Streptomyces sp. NPDC050564 TaxID=3365631 RepID=UPI003797ECE6
MAEALLVDMSLSVSDGAVIATITAKRDGKNRATEKTSLAAKWPALAREILRGETAAADAACPDCGAHAVTCREVGRPDSPTGYAEAQCEDCGHGIYVVRVPGLEG